MSGRIQPHRAAVVKVEEKQFCSYPGRVADLNGPFLAVLLNQADKSGTFKAGKTYATRGGQWSLMAADFNGDGNHDLVTLNNASEGFAMDALSFLMGNRDETFQLPVIYKISDASAGAGLAAADFNGDGLVDLAVANEGDGSVSVLPNKQG